MEERERDRAGSGQGMRAGALGVTLLVLSCVPEDTSTTSLSGTDAASAVSGASAASVATGATTGGSTDAATTASSGQASAGTSEASTSATAPTETATGGPVSGCDPFAQDCPPGMKCAAVDMSGNGVWDSNDCVPVMGDGQPGESCLYLGTGSDGLDDCEQGAMCYFFDEEQGVGSCVALCTGSFEQPACGPACTGCEHLFANSVNICTARVCTPPVDGLCDPEDVCACDGGEKCIPNNATQEFSCVAWPGQESPAGAPCSISGQCEAGMFCVDADQFPFANCQDSPGCCTPYCDVSQGTTDNPVCQDLNEELVDVDGLECVPWYEDGDGPMTCAGNTGVCAVP